MFNNLFGYKIISDIHMVDMVRVRTHKKKRIDKKWLKRYGWKSVPKKDVLIMNGNTIVAHPSIVSQLYKMIDNQAQKELF